MTLILAIETTCDDTAVGIVEDGQKVLANVRISQEQHAKYGGVVPELAARLHDQNLFGLLQNALDVAGKRIEEIDFLAVSASPGLQPAILTGTMTASFLSFLYQKPILPVHHIFGHISSCALGKEKKDVDWPALVLTVSGGHTSFYMWKTCGKVRELGHTRDDAAGECIDKVARMLGLGYPGGPIIEQLAKEGNEHAFEFPRIYLEKESLDFSFSGLKVAVQRCVDRQEESPDALNRGFIRDVCASFQLALVRIFVKKLERALDQNLGVKQFHFVGGVASNQYIRRALQKVCDKRGVELLVPRSLAYCTDNGAMIAGAAYWKLQEDSQLAKVQFIEADRKGSL